MEVALIVAGGAGRRMQTEIPKQFLEIGGRPLLMHTISAFRSYSPSIRIILVLPETEMTYWNKLLKRFQFPDVDKVISGGETRFHSVKAGLQFIKESDIVAIHDGVRPLVSKDIIRENFHVAELLGNAITAVKLTDSIRKITDDTSISVDRNEYRIMQTPQTFKGEIILKAYHQDYHSNFTDDASVLEHSGESIHLVAGDSKNIKVTTPEDLQIIATYL